MLALPKTEIICASSRGPAQALMAPADGVDTPKDHSSATTRGLVLLFRRIRPRTRRCERRSRSPAEAADTGAIIPDREWSPPAAVAGDHAARRPRPGPGGTG